MAPTVDELTRLPEVVARQRGADRGPCTNNTAQSKHPAVYKRRHADAPEGDVLRHWHLCNTLRL